MDLIAAWLSAELPPGDRAPAVYIVPRLRRLGASDRTLRALQDRLGIAVEMDDDGTCVWARTPRANKG